MHTRRVVQCSPVEMNRATFAHDGLTFSYLDSGGRAPVLVFLHAHWMGGSDIADVAGMFVPEWRVLALDQRGHGHTDHTLRLSPEDRIGDVRALLSHLQIEEPVVLWGHSLGGMVAYRFAATSPQRVRALIIEDIGVIHHGEGASFVLEWAGVYPTREALEEKIGARLAPYLEKSIHHTAAGWTLMFEPTEMMLSEHALAGDDWKLWLASACPALVLHGDESRVSDAAELLEMAKRRPNTEYVSIGGAGHSIHIDKPAETIRVVRDFLDPLRQGA